MKTAIEFIQKLKKNGKPSEVPNLQRFFKGPRKDAKCYGVRMGTTFALAKSAIDMPLSEIKKLLKSHYYEARMAAVAIMDFKVRQKKSSDAEKESIYRLYLDQHHRINNWDLVDRAAVHVIGAYLFEKSRKPLYQLAKSKDPWERRTAIVSTGYFLKHREIEETFTVAGKLAADKDVYVQKAIGGWTSYAGKQSEALRMASEKLSTKEKARYR